MQCNLLNGWHTTMMKLQTQLYKIIAIIIIEPEFMSIKFYSQQSPFTHCHIFNPNDWQVKMPKHKILPK